MAHDEAIDRLKRRLQWEGAGPMADVANHATDVLLANLSRLATWMRDLGRDRPLISLLLAVQVGFAFARLGARRENR